MDTAGDVSRLQGRYSLTLITPSSRYFSLFLSSGIAGILAALVLWAYLDIQDYWRIGAVIGILLLTQYIDSLYIRNREYSKSLHSSAFGCSIWMLALLMGIVYPIITGNNTPLFFVGLGLFLFASYRISIYTTVLGCSISRAWAICFVQPVAIFTVLVPADTWQIILLDPRTLIYGMIYLGCATAWSILTDRAGLPAIKSTHELVQAYISSQGGRQHEMEHFMEANSSKTRVLTHMMRFGGRAGCCIVLPEVHPGPYHPVGGSNIPYMIYEKLGGSAMVMHAISDHALNIPSQDQVNLYLQSLDHTKACDQGTTCTIPVVKIQNKSRVTGISFGKTTLLFMSLSPYGMEDLPSSVKHTVDRYAADVGLSAMLVDCHNAMGPEISDSDRTDMLEAAKSCLKELASASQYPFNIGYANSSNLNIQSEDIAMGGLGLLCLEIQDLRYYVGWADANNMENGIREKVVAQFTQTGRTLLEMCTSDTHYNPVKPRNSQGYYQFGLMSGAQKAIKWYMKLAQKADDTIKPSHYERVQSDTSLLLMGPRIFEHYSRAMDRSMNLVKIFMIGSAALFLTTLMV